MKADRILMMDQFFYPEYVTASVLNTQLAEDLAARGIGVDVLCGKPKEYLAGREKAPSRETYKGIRIRRVGYLQLSRKSKLGRLVNYFSFIFSVALRWPSLLGYGLIAVYSTPPLLPLVPALMRFFFGRKFVFICYDLYPDLAISMGAIGKRGLVSGAMRFTNRLTYGRAEKIVALGEEMKRHMLAAGLARGENQIEVIPNWYDGDPTLYTPVGALKRGEAPEASEAPFTVVYSGNMGVCQDMDTIMGCIELLERGHKEGRSPRSPRFEFAGHGVKLKSLKARAASGLGSVKFHGFLMGEEFRALMKSADCFIVSLKRGMEGLAVPSKTYSYLAAGRPVAAIIARDTDTARMLLQYDAGAVFDNGDAEGLARWIESLAADRAAQARMGANARRLFEEHYSREICTGKYADLFERILSGKEDAHE
jgi:glycosyltransferase involved in cell wall biosynthesis